MRSSSSWTTFLLAGAHFICCHHRRARAFSSYVNAAAAVYGPHRVQVQQVQQQQFQRPKNVPFSTATCTTWCERRRFPTTSMMLGVGGGGGFGAGSIRNVRGGGGIGFGGNKGAGSGVPSTSTSTSTSTSSASSSSSSLQRPPPVPPPRGSSSSRSASSVEGGRGEQQATTPPPPPPPPPPPDSASTQTPTAVEGEDVRKKTKRVKKNAEENVKMQKDYSSMLGGLTPATFASDGEADALTYLSTSSITSSGRHRVVFVLGGPGAGKGTQCELLASKYKCVHLSAGELLRQERERNGPHAELIEERISAGRIVPVEISLGLLADAMDEEAAAGAGGSEDDDAEQRHHRYGARIFLVDGFPRNFDNLDGWERIMPPKACVLGSLVFDCPVEELERRILSRGETSGRSDDNLAAARKRFDTFEAETMPVVRVLERNPSLGLSRVVHLAGDRPLDEVTADTERAMNGFVANDVLTANRALLDAVADRDWEAYSKLVDPRMLLRSTSETDEERGGDERSQQRDGGEEEGSKKRIFWDLECTTAARSAEEGEGTTEGRSPGPGAMREDSVVSNANVEVFGTDAVVSYDRSVVSSVPPPTGGSGRGVVLTRVRETRVWRHGPTGWVNVHFVRTPIEG